jgi:hypothetical protein
MVAKIELGGIAVDVVKKDIKNVHLSVYPPTGKVRISAPLRMDLETIRVFAISKLGWIKQQQKRMNAQERESPREYLDRPKPLRLGEALSSEGDRERRSAGSGAKAQPDASSDSPGQRRREKTSRPRRMVSRAAQNGSSSAGGEMGAAHGREG